MPWQLYNELLKESKILTEWKYFNITILFKTGDRYRIKNYRLITLTPTIAKIFSSIVQSRIKTILNKQQPKEKAGFGSTFSNIGDLHTINQLIEKCQEYEIDLHIMALINYNKAFDSIWKTFYADAFLEKQRVSPKYTYILIMQEMYKELKARIKMEKMGNYFTTKKGVRQEDTIFSALEEIFRKTKWVEKRISINVERITNLPFFLIASSVDELQ